MTIVFNNPHGAPVSVNIEDTVVVDKTAEGTTYATQTDTGTLMTTVMADAHHHEPCGHRGVIGSKWASTVNATTWKMPTLITLLSASLLPKT